MIGTFFFNVAKFVLKNTHVYYTYFKKKNNLKFNITNSEINIIIFLIMKN